MENPRLQRFLGAALVCWLTPQLPSLAATIPVFGTCTLADAIESANTLSSNGDVGFPGGGGVRALCPSTSLTSSTVARNKAQSPFGSNVEVGLVGNLTVKDTLIGVKTGLNSCTISAACRESMASATLEHSRKGPARCSSSRTRPFWRAPRSMTAGSSSGRTSRSI